MSLWYQRIMADRSDTNDEMFAPDVPEDLEEAAASAPPEDFANTLIRATVPGEDEKTPSRATGLPYIVIVQGPRSGTRIQLADDKNVIGRAPGCAIRLDDQSVSREHAQMVRVPGGWSVADLGSKNGTSVNGARVRGECELKSGDKLTIGPLEFEVAIRVAVANKKRPRVESIKEAAARTAEGSGTASAVEDVEKWVKEETPQMATIEARRFHLNETEEIDLKTSETQVGPLPLPGTPHAKPGKTQPGKLPPMPASSTKDSGQAATDVLNKFFKRR